MVNIFIVYLGCISLLEVILYDVIVSALSLNLLARHKIALYSVQKNVPLF